MNHCVMHRLSHAFCLGWQPSVCGFVETCAVLHLRRFERQACGEGSLFKLPAQVEYLHHSSTYINAVHLCLTRYAHQHNTQTHKHTHACSIIHQAHTHEMHSWISFGDHPLKLERCREDQHGPCARMTRTHREV